MTNAPERIWARVEPDWHDGETGEDVVGGLFDAGFYKDGTEYIRADLATPTPAEAARVLLYAMMEKQDLWESMTEAAEVAFDSGASMSKALGNAIRHAIAEGVTND